MESRVAEGMGGVVTPYLYGEGRPGLNSVAMGAGLVVTVVLDLLLIPRFQAVGAAVASSSAYIATTAVLLLVFWILTRRRQELPVREPVLGEAP